MGGSSSSNSNSSYSFPVCPILSPILSSRAQTKKKKKVSAPTKGNGLTHLVTFTISSRRMNHIQLLDPPCVASPQSRRLAQTSSGLSSHTCPTVGAVSATTSTTVSTTTMLKPHPETIVPDCAICLDNIRPKHHAKAILACRHEFHLSCISYV